MTEANLHTLQELVLQSDADLRVGGWVAGLRGLRRLELVVNGPNDPTHLDIAGSLESLTTLQDLSLCECGSVAYSDAVAASCPRHQEHDRMGVTLILLLAASPRHPQPATRLTSGTQRPACPPLSPSCSSSAAFV